MVGKSFFFLRPGVKGGQQLCKKLLFEQIFVNRIVGKRLADNTAKILRYFLQRLGFPLLLVGFIIQRRVCAQFLFGKAEIAKNTLDECFVVAVDQVFHKHIFFGSLEIRL